MVQRSTQLTVLALLLLLLLFLLLYTGESGIFDIYASQWEWPTHTTDHTPQPLDLSGDYGKILILSDPHIQCSYDQFEPWLFRWDSDQYVRRAFSRLVQRLQPELVVVLGDLFAEGYKASLVDWEDYLQCMEDIFPVPPGVRVVVVSGDNDIGGEGRENMQKHVDERYRSVFGPLNEVLTFKGATIVKLNTVTHIHGLPANSEESAVRTEATAFLHNVSLKTTSGGLAHPILVFCHVPLPEIAHPSTVSSILSSLTPDFVFSGHIHHMREMDHSYHVAGGGERRARELTVPTCSYRMGEAAMGAGAAVIDPKGQLGYTVLWLPPRYPFLVSYLLSLSLLLALLLWATVCRRGRPFRRCCS